MKIFLKVSLGAFLVIAPCYSMPLAFWGFCESTSSSGELGEQFDELEKLVAENIALNEKGGKLFEQQQYEEAIEVLTNSTIAAGESFQKVTEIFSELSNQPHPYPQDFRIAADYYQATKSLFVSDTLLLASAFEQVGCYEEAKVFYHTLLEQVRDEQNEGYREVEKQAISRLEELESL